MNQELLAEAIEIIAKQLLIDSSFCGSTEGRRLSELLWDLHGKSRSKAIPASPASPQALMTRSLTLPVQLDNALSTIIERSGISRDRLISNALAMLLAENRLA